VFSDDVAVSGAPENPEDETLMEKYSAKAVDYTVKSLMHSMQTEDHDTQEDAAN
jgi:hypothetical protein